MTITSISSTAPTRLGGATIALWRLAAHKPPLTWLLCWRGITSVYLRSLMPASPLRQSLVTTAPLVGTCMCHGRQQRWGGGQSKMKTKCPKWVVVVDMCPTKGSGGRLLLEAPPLRRAGHSP